MRVLGFGTYDVAKHPRIGIVLEGLRAQGDDVLEINEPLGLSTAERVAMLGKPWLSYRLGLRILRRWVSLIRRSRRVGRVDAVLVGYLGQFDVMLARLLFPRTPVVLDLLTSAAETARDRHATGTAKLRALEALDALAVRCADLVVLDTPEHDGLLPGRSRRKGVVVPVGASREWFDAGVAARPPRGGQNPLKVVFFGMFTPLQGSSVIGATLAMLAGRPDIHVTMIGTGQDYADCRHCARTNPRVRWLDWVEAVELPELVAGNDVCLGIFGTTPKAGLVVPNKLYQGAAAGCALVTSATPPQLRAFEGAARFVPAGDPAALAEALEQLAADPEGRARLSHNARDRAVASFSADRVVTELRRRLAD